MDSIVGDLAKALMGVFSGGTVSIIAGCVLLVLVGIGAFILGRKIQQAKYNAADAQGNQNAANDQQKIIEQNQHQAQGNQTTIHEVAEDKKKALEELNKK